MMMMLLCFLEILLPPSPPPEKGLSNVHPPKEGLHTVKFKPESRNRTMTQLENLKIHGLLASLGKTMCKVKWQFAYNQVQNL
jgi:hypothetical protein